MKNLRLLFLLFATFYSSRTFAHTLESGVEARASAFFPISTTYRHIYGIVGPAFAIEGFGKIKGMLWGWTNLQWEPKSGHSIGKGNSTHVNILNWSLGVKCTSQFYENFYPYIGIGPNISTVWIRNHGHCVKSQSKTGYGFVVKSGIYSTLTKHLYMNLFVDYLFQYVHFRKDANVGGFNLGAGLGYSF